MTQEQKDLLLKDLSARVPYNPKFTFGNNVYTLDGIVECVNDEGGWVYCLHAKGIEPIEIELCKPYLFPMSSMTEEQEAEWYDRYITPLCERMKPHTRKEDLMLSAKTHYVSIFWLLENHFDYLGLIEKGLAIDCSNLNIY